jgi:hypothetical protein
MVTLEPGTRQINSFDTEFQMFASLSFTQKVAHRLKSKHQKIPGAYVGIITEGKKHGLRGGGLPVLADRGYWHYTLKH